MNRIPILLILLFFIQPNFVFSKTFNAPELYTIELPNEWIEIPKEILTSYSEKVLNLAPNNPKQIYDFGYQIAANEVWLSNPYILVQVKKTGRIPEKELSRYKKIKSEIKKANKIAENNFSEVLSNIKMGEPIYDEQNKMLWLSISSEVTGVGNIKAILAIKLTNFGIIQFMGYATQDTYEEYLPIFKDSALSAILNEDIIYHPRFEDNFPVIGGIHLGPMAKDGLIGGMIGLIVGFGFWILKKVCSKNS